MTKPVTAGPLPVLAILFAGALWGLFWLPMRAFESENLPGDWLTLLFFILPALTLLPAVLWRRRLSPRVAVAVFVTGIFTGAGSVLYSVSLVLTTVVKAILLFYLTPVWSTLLGYLILRERFSRGRFIALLMGIGGMVVILGSGGIPLPSNTGDWIALLSGITWAYGTVRLYSQQSVPTCESLFCYFGGGAVVAAVVIALPLSAFGTIPDTQVLSQSLPMIAAIAIGLLLPSMFLLYWGAVRLSPARVGLLLMAEVVVGVVSAAWLLDEPFGTREIIGSILIMGAAIVEILSPQHPHQAA